MSDESPYGKLDLDDAHRIAGGANSLLMALQEHAEAGMETADPARARLVKKGVEMGDALLDMARMLVSRGVFSQERHLSEILIYSAAIVDGCEVCALTHIEGAIRAKAPEAVINTVQAIALYVRAQADDDTYLLFDAYTSHWKRFADWPHLPNARVTNLKFYNLIALADEPGGAQAAAGASACLRIADPQRRHAGGDARSDRHCPGDGRLSGTLGGGPHPQRGAGAA